MIGLHTNMLPVFPCRCWRWPSWRGWREWLWFWRYWSQVCPSREAKL